ncbi:uncharacterized protein LOC111286081 isoform X2 [Durio zibethinus]|uniref:Uncharacterized protein LOC111286081 isoform X2 n=1 Tax=Durio zibethinus TaxID=66656 RepID=A0A6P5XTQ1_DURZI|nr:uncharacterized protein LOC111286081 isoform X2 [Durio zibethinus]
MSEPTVSCSQSLFDQPRLYQTSSNHFLSLFEEFCSSPMEQQNNKTNAPRKMRFAPKAPPRRAPKLEVKTEVVEDIDAVQARDLLQRLNLHAFANFYCHFLHVYLALIILLCSFPLIFLFLFSQQTSAKTKPKVEKKAYSRLELRVCPGFCSC